MSHRVSPGRGASAESVSARIGRLVIWPSCCEQIVRQARARGRAGPRGVDRDRDGGGDVGGDRWRRVVVRMRSRGPPSASRTSRVGVRRSPARSARRRARPPRRRRAGGRIALAGGEKRAQPGERRGMQAEATCLPAASPAARRRGRRSKARGRRASLRVADARRGCRPRRARTDRPRRAPPSGGPRRASTGAISNGTGHARPRPVIPARPDDGARRRRFPPASSAARLAAVRPGQAIFAETDDREPGISHAPRPSPGRHDRGEPAGACAGRGRGGGGVFLCRAHRCAPGPAVADADRRLWRGGRACGAICWPRKRSPMWSMRPIPLPPR